LLLPPRSTLKATSHRITAMLIRTPSRTFTRSNISLSCDSLCAFTGVSSNGQVSIIGLSAIDFRG